MPVPVVFFLVGTPLAIVVERLLRRLTGAADTDYNEPGRKRLQWQVEPWNARLRVGVALILPPLAAAAAWRFDILEALAVSVLLIALLVCMATDLLCYRVPNVVTYPGVVLALAAAAFMPHGDLRSALIAVGLSASLFLGVWVLSRGGIGLADVKFAVLIGAALGLPAAYAALALGIIIGGFVMAALLVTGRVSRRQVTPYAPFLALSAIAVVFVQGTVFAPL
jgi:prepilin signal peptidase PulO-like enzyme (type II secretory pathway)